MAGIEVATGELMVNDKPDKSFAKKYGLEGQGKAAKISQSTKDHIRELDSRGRRTMEAGEYFARHSKVTYGGCE